MISKPIILVVLFASFFYILLKKDNGFENKTRIAGESTSIVSATPASKPSLTPTAIPIPTIAIETPSPTRIPTSLQAFDDKSLLYPGATIVSSGSHEFILYSNDNPDTITPWYKEKIRAMGMSSKSFVVTKTNGNVLNKLVGAGHGREVRVEIAKQANESITVIKLYFVTV